MLTLSEFYGHLLAHDYSKPVCFCSCPTGLQIFRFKRRGPNLMQLEFGENVYRTKDGELRVEDSVTETVPTESYCRQFASTVGELLKGSKVEDIQEMELVFGDNALTFKKIVDFGSWVSVEFEERIYRGEDGRLVAEYVLNGKPVSEVFPFPTILDIGPPFVDFGDGNPHGRN